MRNQVPEYVGAPQKHFAWSIGVALASIMFVMLVLLNYHTPINGIICLICLVFLFFETAFGICLGCKFYPLFFKNKAQHCPGEVCEVHERHPIQKVSWQQIAILVAFIGGTLAVGFALKDFLSVEPTTALGAEKPEKFH